MLLWMLKFFLIAGVLIAAVFWFADHPGLVAINWEGWVVETNVPLLGILVLLLALLISVVWRFWQGVKGIPSYFRRKREEKKTKRIIEETARGLSAVAGGDALKGGNHAARALEIGANNPLALLLSAQSAALSGDLAIARRDFNQLATDKKTAVLGLRGLANIEIKEGDLTLALEHMRQANYLNPGLPTILTTLFELQIRAKAWEEALQSLETGNKKGLFPHYARQKAAIYYEMAQAATDNDDALKLLRRALDADECFIPAQLLKASLLAKMAKEKKAADAIVEAWAKTPHPDLLALYLKLWDDNEMSKLGRVQRLVQGNSQHAMSKYALAQAFLATQLWGEARAQLEPDIKSGACGKGFYTLMAEVEKGEKGLGSPELLGLLEKAASLPEGEAWHCGHCGRQAAGFQAFCNHCGQFASIDWIYPLQAGESPASTLYLLGNLNGAA